MAQTTGYEDSNGENEDGEALDCCHLGAVAVVDLDVAAAAFGLLVPRSEHRLLIYHLRPKCAVLTIFAVLLRHGGHHVVTSLKQCSYVLVSRPSY